MALAVFTAALGAPRAAEAQHADETRIVSQIRATVRCTADGCQSTVTIVDDDEALFSDEQVVHSGAVTIEAKNPTALQGIDDLVFTVTRAVDLDSDLEVPVTLSAGIIDADTLSHTVTIGASETSAELRVHTRTLDPAAVTGDVIATADDGEQYDVPDPSTASVRVFVGDPLVTVRFDAESYMLAEGGGAGTGEVALLAQTEPSVPAPRNLFYIAVSTREGTATSPEDYEALSSHVPFPGSSSGSWIADGDAFVAEVRVPLTIVDDTEAEGDETLRLLQELTPGLPSTVHYAPADPVAQTCSAIHYCEAAVTIIDDDGRSVVVGQTGELAVAEGGTASYTVALGSEPTGEVIVTPSVYSTTDSIVSVSPALRFTPDVWAVPQAVTVTASIDFNDVDGSARSPTPSPAPITATTALPPRP